MKIGVIAVGSAVGLLVSASAWAVRPTAQCPYADAAAVAAAVAQSCPCDGLTDQTGQVTPWKNHGQYQRCVVHARNTVRKQGCSVAGIAACSARSTCGKPDKVLCCWAKTGTCDSPCSNDPTLTCCSNDPTLTCTTDDDCTLLSKPKIRRPDVCAAGGGYASGTGSVCVGCQPPVACCVSSSTGGPGTCEILTVSDCSTQGTVASTVPSCASVTCP
jgi:hypothetical protein